MLDIGSVASKLRKSDQHLLEQFLLSLLEKERYKKLRKEIESRRLEVKNGECLTHEEFWDKADV